MGHTPYGYRIENGMAVVDEEQAEHVRKLYEGYLSGLGLKDASERAGLSVTHCQAKRMMLNEKYLGTDYYPQIITADVIEKVREELQKRATALGRNYEPKEKEVRHPAVQFRFGNDIKFFADPVLRAQYRYSIIEEVRNDG